MAPRRTVSRPSKTLWRRQRRRTRRTGSCSLARWYGNESWRILESRWLSGVAGDLWARMEQGTSLTGNAFVAKIEDDELLMLPPQEVVIVSETVRSSGGIKYRRVIGYDWDPTRL